MTWRYYNTAPMRGARNMAHDEAMLKTAPPSSVTLRTYTWEPACLSLGCFQKYSEVNFGKVKENGFDVVRRPTGGRAVLHDKELTYSIVITPPHDILNMNVLTSYYLLCEGIISGLNSLGVNAVLKKSDDKELSTPSCFAAPTFNDIESGGRKLVGSAQMRTREGLLQHGSILLDVDIKKLFDVVSKDEDQSSRLAGAAKAKITSVNEQLGFRVGLEQLKENILNGFSDSFGIGFEEVTLDGDFLAEVDDLEKNKYNSAAWTENR
ncbi:MAG: lipoate--protein ligase family protein [Caldisericales bacterium]|nr:lipoate--protein ligase family protein [Caldisericales bacterium]